MTDSTGYLKLDNAADYLGVSKSTIRRLINEGKLSYSNIGTGSRKLIVIPKEELNKFATDRKVMAIR